MLEKHALDKKKKYHLSITCTCIYINNKNKKKLGHEISRTYDIHVYAIQYYRTQSDRPRRAIYLCVCVCVYTAE